MTGLFQVVGNPVAHSLSPDIHRAFAEQLGLAIQYEKNAVAPGGFSAAVAVFRAQGGRGMNVTVPFKGDAFTYAAGADGLDDLARAAGAVNTLDFSADGCRGYNTDGLGIVRDLVVRHGIELSGATVLVLGAGGATRGVLLPLLHAGVKTVVIANRTVARAEQLIRDVLPAYAAADTVQVSAVALPQTAATAVLWEEASQRATTPVGVTRHSKAVGRAAGAGSRIVINATSIGLSQRNATLPVHRDVVAGAFCYDMSYGEKASFARWAAQCAVAGAVDGLGMLVEQAAESCLIWHGQRPDTAAIYEKLRKKIDGLS